MFTELDNDKMLYIEGGCGWCYTGAVFVIAGGYVTGGPLGGLVAAVGVASVLLT